MNPAALHLQSLAQKSSFLPGARSLASLAHMVAALPMRRAEEPLTVVAAANAVMARRSETVLAALREPGQSKARHWALQLGPLSRLA